MDGIRCLALVAALMAGSAAADPAAAPVATASPWPGDAELEAQAARIGAVSIRIEPIFDPEAPGERKAVFRMADRLHVDTRESAIEAQLLFRSGDAYSHRVVEETERKLRELRFINEPQIRIVGYHDGLVDLEVVTHEVWTTNPGISFGRAGGSNSSGLQLEELNLLGFGKHLAFDYHDDIDRSSYTIKWRDPSIAGSRWRNMLALTDSDDGEGQVLEFERPFYSLDARWSAGFGFDHDDSIQKVYRLGRAVAEYRQDAQVADARFGRSRGLRNGWAHRWITGLRHEEAQFSEAPTDFALALLPDDRSLTYPYLRLESMQDDFETARNLDQIARTEDLQFGLRYAVELGWAATAWGSDRNAAMLRTEVSRGFRLGDGQLLFLSGALAGRLEGGSPRDSLLSGSLRYYRHTSPSSTFFASVNGELGHELDADHELQLGGDNGLRGYPLRYQTGSGRAFLTLEQRFYTGRSLWRLADIGGAVFFDMGEAWGPSAFGSTGQLGLLKDIGFGLRLGNTRSALGNVIHVDVAFPLDGDHSISQAQFLVQTKHSF
jgi:outer membrane protein assembly factor BamA